MIHPGDKIRDVDTKDYIRISQLRVLFWRSDVNLILTMYPHGDRGMTIFCDFLHISYLMELSAYM